MTANAVRYAISGMNEFVTGNMPTIHPNKNCMLAMAVIVPMFETETPRPIRSGATRPRPCAMVIVGYEPPRTIRQNRPITSHNGGCGRAAMAVMLAIMAIAPITIDVRNEFSSRAIWPNKT